MTKEKISALEARFALLRTDEERYMALIELGRALPPFLPEWKVEENRVHGCQSLLYLHTKWNGERLHFSVFSEALISAGLAALLLWVYSDEAPESILATSPSFLQTLGILGALSPSRSNGLAHVHARIKQEALQCFSRQR